MLYFRYSVHPKTSVFSLPLPGLVMEVTTKCLVCQYANNSWGFRRDVVELQFLDLLDPMACPRLARAQSCGLLLVNRLYQEASAPPFTSSSIILQ